MTNRGNIGRSALWSLFEGGLAQILALAVFMATAHFIAPADFGILATAMLIIELYRQVVIEAAITAVNAQKVVTDEDYNACFFMVAAVSAVAALIVFLIAPSIGGWLDKPRLADALQPISLLVLTLGLSRTHEAYLSRHLQFKILALRSFISIAVGGGVGIYMAFHGYGLWSLISQQLTTAILSLILLWGGSRWQPRPRFTSDNVRKILSYAKHVSATGATNFANTQSDIAFSAMYLGSTNTGLFNAAKRIAMAMNQTLASSLNRVALPTLAKSRGDNERSQRVLLSAVSLTSSITAPAFAGVAALAPDAIQLALGEKWLPAAPILSIISLTYFLSTIGQYTQTVILVNGKPHWQTIITAINAVANVALFFLVVRFGVLAVALASTARALLIAPISFGLGLSLIDLKWRAYAQALMPPVTSAVMMGLAVAAIATQMTSVSPLVRIAVLMPVGVAIYGGLLWSIRREAIVEVVSMIKQTIGSS